MQERPNTDKEKGAMVRFVVKKNHPVPAKFLQEDKAYAVKVEVFRQTSKEDYVQGWSFEGIGVTKSLDALEKKKAQRDQEQAEQLAQRQAEADAEQRAAHE